MEVSNLIGVINYGLGNVKAFKNIYERLNISAKIVSSLSDLDQVNKLILPGVGSFDSAIELFKKDDFHKYVEELIFEKRIPILGVCIGMHIMAKSSEEGNSPGLGWIDAKVKKFKFQENKYPLPHLGWNSIEYNKNSKLFKDIVSSEFYFLHSYYCEVYNNELVLSFSNYGGLFCSSFNMDNIYGLQFHPEKSHNSGIKILKNFAQLDHA